MDTVTLFSSRNHVFKWPRGAALRPPISPAATGAGRDPPARI